MDCLVEPLCLTCRKLRFGTEDVPKLEGPHCSSSLLTSHHPPRVLVVRVKMPKTHVLHMMSEVHHVKAQVMAEVKLDF